MIDSTPDPGMTGRPISPNEQQTLIEGQELVLGHGTPFELGPLPVKRVGDYELLAEIGRGGMGVVFKARHVKLNRLVALKMILGGSLAHKDDLHRFDTEAAAAAQLQHPGIVGLYEIGAYENQPYFSMEFISGSSLAQHVAKGPLHSRRSAAYLEAVARSVHYAHSRGILHRDLKPANVLLDDKDQTKVTDFGLAKLLATDSNQTRTGAVLGTPSYMSPEQASGRKNLGPASDVWSLGAILYELLTAKPPFRGETALATLTLVSEQEPVAPRLLNPAIDRDLETICLKCLEKDSRRRYESAESLADDLRRYLDGEPISARRLSRFGRAVKWCRRKPTAAALLAVCILAIGIFISISWWNAANERELRAEAEKSREEMNHSLREQQKLLYMAQMRQAQDALQVADHGRADKLLEQWATGERAGLRDWEWYFLKERAHGRFSLAGHRERTTAVAYSPDDDKQRLASAGGPALSPNDIKIWDPSRGTLLFTLPGHKKGITALAYSSDGKLLASSSIDGTVKIWDPERGIELATLHDNDHVLTAVAFRPQTNDHPPEKREIAVACADGTVTLWKTSSANLEQWEKAPAIKAHKGPVTAIAYGPVGLHFATAGLDKEVRLWKPDTGEFIRSLPGLESEIHCLAFNKSGQILVAGGGKKDGEVQFYDFIRAKVIASHFGLSAPIHTVAFSRDGKLAAGGQDGQIRIWGDQNHSSECITFRGDTQSVYALAFSKDNRLACAGRGGNIRLYNSAGGQETLILNEPARSEAVAFSPNSKLLASSGRNTKNQNLIQIWDLEEDAVKPPFPLLVTSLPKTLGFCPKGRLLATGGEDRILRIYDLRKATSEDPNPRERSGHTGPITAVVFHPNDENLVASAGEDGQIHLWDVSETNKDKILTGHTKGVLSLAFSPDGRYLASGSRDNTVRLWDLQTTAAPRIFKGHSGPVQGVAFSPDGKFLASASGDKTIRLWNLTHGDKHRILEGSPSGLNALAFHRGGNRLASAGQDNVVRLWDLGTGQEILELEVRSQEQGRSGPLHGVAFSPDGRRLACAGPNIRPRLWEGTP